MEGAGWMDGGDVTRSAIVNLIVEPWRSVYYSNWRWSCLSGRLVSVPQMADSQSWQDTVIRCSI